MSNEKIYDNEISPLMQEIIRICNEHGIPMIASFNYDYTEDNGIGRCTTLINNIKGKEDDVLQKANHVLRHGNHSTFTTVIKSNE